MDSGLAPLRDAPRNDGGESEAKRALPCFDDAVADSSVVTHPPIAIVTLPRCAPLAM